jgi:hypothetical protein
MVQSVITTKNLPEYVFTWMDREQKLSPKAPEKYADRGSQSLSDMNTTFSDWWLSGYIPVTRGVPFPLSF